MKKGWLVASMVLGGCGAVSAQTTAMKTDPVAHEMKAMDSNGDGRISAQEHAAGVGRMFETMDADKDGRVTASEMQAAHGKVTGGKAAAGEMSAAEKIKTIDTNGDGVLTAAEHEAGARRMFEHMDADKDGFLTKDELAAGHSMKMKH